MENATEVAKIGQMNAAYKSVENKERTIPILNKFAIE